MNKHRRHELKMLKYKKRLRNYQIKDDSKGNFYAFRSHGAPCSCYACQQVENNYNRAKEKSRLPRLIDFELNYDKGEMEFNKEQGIFIYCEN